MTSILITGATSGIGKALALHAAKQGYRVIACGRNETVLSELAEKPNIETCQFDVTNLSQTKDALSTVSFDIAVLNAGTCEYVDIDDFESDMFHRVFDVNLFGIIHCVEGLMPNLNKGKQLVVIDSMARLVPFTRSQAYGASKAAVHYFTKSLEVDLQPKGVLVQAVSPGFVETPLTDKNDFDMPMKIGVDEAVTSLLKGIESKHKNIYFPSLFGWILRTINSLPDSLKTWLSSHMKQ